MAEYPFFAGRNLGWMRWMPFATRWLLLVPAPGRFRVSEWEKVDWDAPLWLDPGSPADTQARLYDAHGDLDEEEAQDLAMEVYRRRVQDQTERIARFNAVAARVDHPRPYSLRDLLSWCVHVGLFEMEDAEAADPYVWPRFDRNVLDQLPFTAAEAEWEAAAQHKDRYAHPAIVIGHLSHEQTGGFDGPVTVTLDGLASAMGESTARIRQTLPALTELFTYSADVSQVRGDEPFTITIDALAHFDYVARYLLL